MTRAEAKMGGRRSTEANSRDRILRRIKSLLQRTVERGATQPEMEASLALAERLMLKHGLSRGEVRQDEAFTKAPLTSPGAARAAPEDRWIAALLWNHFCVRPVTDHRGRLILVGRPHELHLAGYVAVTLRASYRRLWREHRRPKDPGDEVLRRALRAVGQRPLRKDRYSFYAGLSAGLDVRLARERKTAVAQDASIGTALARSSRDLDDYIQELVGDRIGKKSARRRKVDPLTFRIGFQAGESIRLHKPLPEVRQ